MEASTSLLVLVLAAAAFAAGTVTEAAGDGCSGCDLALASFYVTPNQNVTNMAELFGIGAANYRSLAPYNPNIPNLDFINVGGRVNVYFACGCRSLPGSPSATYLAGAFPFQMSRGQTYTTVAANYNNLTTAEWLQATNSYPPNNIPDTAVINATVNCSCGDASISPDYGLFLTYPLRAEETLASVAATYGLSSQLDVVRRYNPGMESATGSGIVYIPVKGKGASAGAIAGGVVAGVVVLAAIFLYIIFYRRRKAKQATLLQSSEHSTQLGTISMDKVTPSTIVGPSPVAGITVDKSVEFSYEELSNATQGFSIGNKIGQGGFGAVYYAELRGEKAAIKKMDMQATHEFLAELKVLTHVHHLNLVADFGLTKLTEVGGTSMPTGTRVVGTFGYMPPEYARYGDVSPKVDVYAFGVVLYELISAKEAIVRSTESSSDSKGLFEEALNSPDPKEGLRTLIDPKLGEDYPIDSILKLTQLAKVCTQEDPKLRPSMRSVVVALMTLSSTSEFWDMNNLYENQGLVNLMSGR
uniref:Protein kinase domain-containing protein n=1 Tax=Oryza meridionalis TaxID=40149 RepID=A0A0E0END6_9ORYZ